MELRKLITLTKVLLYSSIALGLVAIFIFLVLGDSQHPHYFYGALVALPLFGLAIFLHFRRRKLKHLLYIRNQWGKAVTQKRNFDTIALYHRFNPSLGTIDDSTWHDLNMDELYSRIDRTLTSPGEGVLYQLLRTPCTAEGVQELRYRDQLISLLLEDARAREALQIALSSMSKDSTHTLTHLLWDRLPAKNPWAFIYSLLALAALAVLAAPFILGPPGLSLVMVMFSINSIVHYQVRKKYSFHIPSITSLSALFRAARRLVGARLPGMEKEQRQLKAGLAATRKLQRKVRYLFLDTGTTSDILILIQYIQILFLVEVRSFYGALEEIKRTIEVLREVYSRVGFLDAMQAAASYRVGLDYTQPEFTADKCLKAVNIRHPLLDEAVPNSIAIQDQGILITGSNMAGKSTFLRTLGVNVILAQSLYISTAESYTASFLFVATSINKADNISQQKSLYFAEAERLLNIIRPHSDEPTLLLIDELLSGTNYTERLAASAAILNYLRNSNALVVVATHDLDLAENLGETYLFYHFSDKVDRSNLDFDYTLKPGIATSRNAIKLLEHLGYPQEITQEANNRFASKMKL